MIIGDYNGTIENDIDRENTRVVLNILDYGDEVPGKKIGLFFMDAEKAFNNVSWCFVKKTFKAIIVGPNF